MKKLTILQLYPANMNIYGDQGNVLTLKKRIEWRGLEAKVTSYNLGDNFDELSKNADIIIGGGGQDSGQILIHEDLLKIGQKLKDLADDGMPMLVICGLYQLFGASFTKQDGVKLSGIWLFDAHTIAKQERLTGNIVIDSPDFGKIIGYENHSGQTFLGDKTHPLGKVITGAGNNERDGHEGARHKNVIGSYLHGSLLPKNPRIADFLVETALARRYKNEGMPELVLPENLKQITAKARNIAMKRPR